MYVRHLAGAGGYTSTHNGGVAGSSPDPCYSHGNQLDAHVQVVFHTPPHTQTISNSDTAAEDATT